MNAYLLDTHVWVEAQLGETAEFDRGIRKDLERSQARRQVWISAISILELARLVSLGQRSLPSSVDDFASGALGDDGLLLLDLTPRILIDSTRLPGEIHRDTSDRLIVDTARAHGLTLVTGDKLLLSYAKQGHLSARKP